jgi:hypothetical protein
LPESLEPGLGVSDQLATAIYGRARHFEKRGHLSLSLDDARDVIVIKTRFSKKNHK